MIFIRKLVVRRLILNGFSQNKRKTSESSSFSNHVDFVVELYFENLRLDATNDLDEAEGIRKLKIGRKSKHERFKPNVKMSDSLG